MIRLSTLVCVLGALALGAPGPGQPRTAFPEKRGLKASDFPRVVRLAENVYGYEELRNPGMTTVSLFVVGRDGVLLADGQGSVEATRKLLDAIERTAGKPVRWYVVGSDHGDHTAGNAVLPSGVTFIVHPTSRAQLERDRAAAEKARADAAAKKEGASAPAARAPVIVPPVAMRGDTEVIDVGGIEVRVRFLGRAHTGGDLMVHLPQQKILFMSEAFLNRVFPAMRSAYPSEWVEMLDRALTLDVDRFVPGHGFIEEPKASREELVEYQRALRHVIAEVRRLHALGLSPDEARKRADWGPYRDWMLADQQDVIAIRKVYEEIEGRLPRVPRG
jgi:glyoxylase-like metal-dependent hydrolase (beta-lactamase superfamily II)